MKGDLTSLLSEMEAEEGCLPKDAFFTVALGVMLSYWYNQFKGNVRSWRNARVHPRKRCEKVRLRTWRT